MESVERKDASAGPEEPIKSEGMVPSPDTSEKSNGASSPPPNCSICLGKLINTSFTDSCLHQFCFTCLLQWSKIKTECPLCKQTFKSIIHNVRSEEDYDQYHVQYTSQMAAMLDVTTDVHISGQLDLDLRASARPFMYRTTAVNNNHHRLLNPQAVARREQIPSIAHQVSSEERRLRNANPLEFRRRIYRTNVWATPLPDAFGRFRECSADYYRRNPSEIHRIIPWINRELQVLTNNQTHHIAYVMHVLTDLLTLYDINSIEFHNAVRPFFGQNTEQFAHELSNFARTNFDLIGYDHAVTYLPNRGLSNEYVPRLVSPPSSSSSSSSSDSDVQIVQYNALHIFPGPSTVGPGFRLQMPYTRAPDVLTISSTSSSSENDCEVVGYVKPRHERTPEIIDLSSSEAEEINSLPSTSNNNVQSEALIPLKEEVIPSTSSSGDNNASRRMPRRAILAKAMAKAKARMYGYLGSTSESDSEETDSDYNPANTKSRRHKSSKKSSKISPRKLRSRKRKKSTGAQQKQRIRSYSSCDSENESPQLATSSSRGLKRYLSKSSEGTDCEKVVKKSKKNKKSKSTKKNKKRVVSSKANCRSYSSSCSSKSSSGSNSEVENAKSSRRQKKKKKSSAPLNSYSYSSEEHPANEASKRSSKKSSEVTESYRYSSEEEPSTSVPQVIDQRKDSSSKFPDSDYSNYHRRFVSSRHSSSESFDSRKNHERLQNSEADNNKHYSSEEADRSVYSDEASSSNAKRKDCIKPVIALNEELSDKYSSPNVATTSSLSSKSDASSLTEHSASSKTSSSSRGRHRSHKKRKDSKKRRRSRS